MEKIIKVKNEYNSLDTLHSFLKTVPAFECSKEYDSWDVRTDINGQMKQCIILKKSSMHAVKLHFIDENTIKANHIIPSKLMHAYFGKSQKRYQNILEIVTGKIKETLLVPSQEKAFQEMEQVLNKVSA